MKNTTLKLECLKGWLKQQGLPSPRKSSDIVYERREQPTNRQINTLIDKFNQ